MNEIGCLDSLDPYSYRLIMFTYIICPYPNHCWQEMKVALTMSEDGLNLTGTLDAQDCQECLA